MPFIRAGELVVHYELTGPAHAPVLMLGNSLGTSFHVWDAVAPRLAQRYRLLRYDMRGHGLTDLPDSAGWTIDMLARDALALLNALSIERFTYCGLSIGGMVAQRLGAVAGDRLEALVLCDTGSRIGTQAIWDERVGGVRREGMKAVTEGVLARWFTRAFHETRTAELRGFENMLLRTPVEGYAGCSLAIRDADLTEDARRIGCPALVIVGDEDASTPPELARALRDTIGERAELSVIAGCAHIPPGEKPQELLALIEGFLGRVLSAGEGYDAGLAVRKSVLGAEHVERSLANATSLDKPFQEFITKFAWGGLWTRPGLDRKTRSMVTLATLAALGREGELRLHLRASRNTGVSETELQEVFLHTAIYAGVPAANAAFAEAKKVLSA